MLNRLVQRQMSAAMLVKTPTRQFSLLVPLNVQQSAPAELMFTPLTIAASDALQQAYTEFNASCASQLEEMNKNVISNIIARGGNNGWETAENLDDLKKSFNFDSFE